MKMCPRCGKEYERLLALSRTDNKTMICDQCGTEEALDAAGLMDGSQERKRILNNAYGNGRKPTPYERTRAQVYATGNKWAIENFEATHS